MQSNNDFSTLLKPQTKGSQTTSDDKSLFDFLPFNINKSNPSNFYKNCRSETDKNSNAGNYSSTKDEDLPLDKDIIFCYKCRNPYYIIFTDNLDLSFNCGCSLLKNLTINEYKKEYKKGKLFEEKSENPGNNYFLHCEKHDNETKFDFYCIDCKYDLCKECLKEDSELYSNTGRRYKTRENHTLIKFDEIIQRFKSIEETIEKHKDLEDNEM